MISKQAEGFTDALSGGAVKFNPYDSLELKSGLVSNPMEEQAFKGVPFRQFSFSFQFAPTSPEEAKMMQNIIQTFGTTLHLNCLKAQLNFLHHTKLM